jgi:hypothetical protein
MVMLPPLDEPQPPLYTLTLSALDQKSPAEVWPASIVASNFGGIPLFVPSAW